MAAAVKGQHQSPVAGPGRHDEVGGTSLPPVRYTGVTVCRGRLSACGEIPRDQGPAGRKAPSPRCPRGEPELVLRKGAGEGAGGGMGAVPASVDVGWVWRGRPPSAGEEAWQSGRSWLGAASDRAKWGKATG